MKVFLNERRMRGISCALRIIYKIAEEDDKIDINILNTPVSRLLNAVFRTHFRTWFRLVNLLVKNLVYMHSFLIYMLHWLLSLSFALVRALKI